VRVDESPEPELPEAVLAVADCLTTWESHQRPPDEAIARAVRSTLQLLARRAPGRSVEVRVPPWGAVQCVAGPRHTRGTPRAVVETDGRTWVLLAAGRLDLDSAVRTGRLVASGERSDLSDYLPLLSA
jgi:Bacterial SCP ortholog